MVVGICSGCQQKQLDVKISEVECKDLRLSNATFSAPQSYCNIVNKPLTYTHIIRFNHNGKSSCLDFLKLNAKFLTQDGSEISGVTFKNTYRSTDPEVRLTDADAQITVTWTMPNQNQANALYSAEFELFTENDLQNASNKLYFTISFGCSKTVPSTGSTYDIVRDVTVTKSTINCTFYDYASEDGDTLDVYLNDVKVISRLGLTKKNQTFSLTIKPGTNTLAVIALNTGSSGPNTCGIIIENQSPIKLTPGLSKGQGVNINF